MAIGIFYEEETTIKKERLNRGEKLIKFVSDYVVIDIETTGFSSTDNEIIEVAAIRIRNDIKVDEFSSLIKPSVDISKRITKLTGITNEMLVNEQPIEKVLPDFIEFIGDDILVGHNVSFDINFLYDALMNCCNMPLSNDSIDTMRLARKYYPNFENYKLCTLTTNFCINSEDAHRALADVIATQLCYEHIKKFGVRNLQIYRKK